MPDPGELVDRTEADALPRYEGLVFAPRALLKSGVRDLRSRTPDLDGLAGSGGPPLKPPVSSLPLHAFGNRAAHDVMRRVLENRAPSFRSGIRSSEPRACGRARGSRVPTKLTFNLNCSHRRTLGKPSRRCAFRDRRLRERTNSAVEDARYTSRQNSHEGDRPTLRRKVGWTRADSYPHSRGRMSGGAGNERNGVRRIQRRSGTVR